MQTRTTDGRAFLEGLDATNRFRAFGPGLDCPSEARFELPSAHNKGRRRHTQNTVSSGTGLSRGAKSKNFDLLCRHYDRKCTRQRP